MSRKFNDYIKAARKVYFVTDHNPLHWLRKQRDPRGKFARWIQELESLDYEIVYTKGNQNNAADFLSRIESDIDSQVNNEFEYFERFVYHLTMSYPELVEMIEKEQLKDQAIKYAREQVSEVGYASRGRYNYQHLTISDGLLLRNGKILVPEAMRNSVLTIMHNQAHPEIKRTTFIVKENFTWDGLSVFVRQFCKKCEICHKNKHKTGSREPITPITIASSPRKVVAYDVATLPWGNGYRYFLQITDMFSKWIELVPMRNQTSHKIVEALESSWILRHGPPEIFLSDQGPNVDGTEIRDALRKWGIKKRRSSPYHPQGDGQSERGIQTTKQTLRCMLAEKKLEKESWHQI